MNLNPIEDLKALAAKIKHEAKVDFMKELAAMNLSRLVVLDPDNAGDYHAALTAIGKDAA